MRKDYYSETIANLPKKESFEFDNNKRLIRIKDYIIEHGVFSVKHRIIQIDPPHTCNLDQVDIFLDITDGSQCRIDIFSNWMEQAKHREICSKANAIAGGIFWGGGGSCYDRNMFSDASISSDHHKPYTLDRLSVLRQQLGCITKELNLSAALVDTVVAEVERAFEKQKNHLEYMTHIMMIDSVTRDKVRSEYTYTEQSVVLAWLDQLVEQNRYREALMIAEVLAPCRLPFDINQLEEKLRRQESEQAAYQVLSRGKLNQFPAVKEEAQPAVAVQDAISSMRKGW